MIVLNDLLYYKNLKIYQDNESFVFSLDSVLLPKFIDIPKNTRRILDIGTGNAPIPLVLSTRTDAKIVGVEIQESIAELARKSVEINELEDQIEIINEDIKKTSFEAESFDMVLSNPPYFKVAENGYLSEKTTKLIARHEVALDLESLVKISARYLKHNGVFGLVHRPERLVDIIDICRKNKLEVKRVQFVYPKKNEEANIVLVEAVKNGKSGLKVLEPIITYENGKYTEEIMKYFKGSE